MSLLEQSLPLVYDIFTKYLKHFCVYVCVCVCVSVCVKKPYVVNMLLNVVR